MTTATLPVGSVAPCVSATSPFPLMLFQVSRLMVAVMAPSASRAASTAISAGEPAGLPVSVICARGAEGQAGRLDLQIDRSAEARDLATALCRADGARDLRVERQIGLRPLGMAGHGDGAGRLGGDIGQLAERQGPIERKLLRGGFPAALRREIDVRAMHRQAGERDRAGRHLGVGG